MKLTNHERSHAEVILALGAVWGLSEALLGMWLQRCASQYSGAIMTGLAFFYLSFVWTSTRRVWPLVLLFIMVALFKMLDALLLSISLNHGAVVNPIFAFFLETLFFILSAGFLRKQFMKNWRVRSAIGAGAALASALFFPLTGLFTGVPACLYPGTGIPLSVYTAPLAMLIGLITVPLGALLAEGYNKLPSAGELGRIGKVFRYSWSPLLFMLCLVIMTLVRLI